jgi:hypothetical protein
MNARYTLLVCLSILLLAPGRAHGSSSASEPLAGTYIIGESGDYTTFGAAVTALHAHGVAGPVVFEVLSGTYEEQMLVEAIAGASAVNTVTFRSATGNAEDVVIQYAASGTADNYVLRLNGARHLRVEGVTIRALGASYSGAVDIASIADDVIFLNNRFEGPANLGQNRRLVRAVGVRTVDLVFVDNTFVGGSSALYLSGTSPRSTGTLISGNVFSNSFERAVSLTSTTDAVITGNEVTARDGLFIQSGGGAMRIEKNRITVEQTGMYVTASGGSADSPGLVANNFISASGNGKAVHLATNNHHIQIYHNTLVNTSTGSAFEKTESSVWATASGITLRNNILAATSGAALHSNNPSGISSDFNNLYSAGSVLVQWGPSSYITLAEYSGATAQDSNSLQATPDFDGYTPRAPALASAGMDLTTWVPDDLFGHSRPSTPSLGAVEYESDLLPLAGTYTIGSAGDYPTFTAAVADLTSRGVSAAVVFDVLAGTYIEQVAIVPVTGASRERTITFRSATGDASDVVLQYAASGTLDNFVLQLSGLAHAAFENLTLRATGSDHARVVAIDHFANNITFRSNRFEGQASSWQNRELVVGSSARTIDLVFEENAFVNGASGIALQGLSSTTRSTGTVIVGNVFSNGYGRAVSLTFHEDVVIEDNEIGGHAGMMLHTSRGTLRLAKNRIAVLHNALYLYASGGTADSPWLIANNFMSVSGGGAAVSLSHSDNHIRFYHNSVIKTSSGYPFEKTGSFGTAGTGVELLNNIFSTTSGAVLYATNNIGVVSNHNSLFNTGGTVVVWGSNSYTSLEDFQATGQDLNSLFADPDFDGYTPQAPALATAGADLRSIVPNDLFGNDRSATPSLGAVEYAPVIHAPVAGDLDTITGKGATLDIDVLVVATIAEGDDVSIVSVDDPEHGTAEIIAEGETWLIRYTPDPDFEGSETFSYTIAGLTGSDSGTITVTINRPPSFASAPVLVATTGRVYSYAIALDDPEGDPVELTLTPENQWLDLALVEGTWVLTGMPDADDVGELDVVLRANDGYNTTEQAFTITVSLNQAPVFTSVHEAGAVVDEPFSFTVTVEDADGDPVTLSLAAGILPDGLSFTANTDNTATIEGSPTEVGSFVMTFLADDGLVATSQEFTLTVGYGFTAPVTGGPIHVMAGQGRAVDIDVLAEATVDEQDEVTIVLLSAPDHGTAVVATTEAGSVIRYTPEEGQTEAVGFSYHLQGLEGASAEATVQVTINLPPSFTSDPVLVATTGRLYSYTVTLSDPEDDALALALSPGDAWLVIQETEEGWLLSGTPSEADGSDLEVTLIADDGYNRVEQVFAIAVTSNQAPAFVSADEATAVIGEPFSFLVEATDADGDDMTLSISVGTLPAGLDFTDNGNGTATLQGTPGEAGDYFLTFTAHDGLNGTDQAFTLSVVFGFAHPIAGAIEVVTGLDVPVDVDVLSAATIAEGDAVEIVLTRLPDVGTAEVITVDDVSFVRYTPAEGQSEPASFDYVLLGLSGSSEDATITVTINLPPVITSDPVLVATSGRLYSYTIGLTDPEEDPVAMTLSPEHTWLALELEEGNWVLSGTPAAEDEGEIDVILSASDSYNAAEQAFTITVSLNEAPVFTSAEEVSAVVDEEFSFVIEAEDADGDHLVLSLLAGTLPAGVSFEDNGDNTAALSGIPTETGDFVLTFAADDGLVATTQDFTLTVGFGFAAPVASSLEVTTGQDIAIEVDVLADATIDTGDEVSIVLVSAPALGIAVVVTTEAGTVIRYTPGEEQTEAVSFDYALAGLGGTSEAATVTVTINLPPIFASEPVLVATSGRSYVYSLVVVDPEDDVLALELVSEAGWLDLALQDHQWVLSGTPADEDVGAVEVTLVASDDFNRAEQAFSIEVSLNGTPFFTSADRAEAVLDETFSFEVTAEDPDGDTLALTVVSGELPDGLSFTDNGDNTASISGVPAAAGDFLLTLEANDGIAAATQQLTIHVGYAFEAPIAGPVEVMTGQGLPVDVDVLAGATIAEGDAVTITAVDDPDNGTAEVVEVQGIQLIRYTPDAEFEGTETFAYTISGLGGSDASTVTVIINRPPAFTSDPHLVATSGRPYSYTIGLNDPETDELTLTLSPDEGWLSLELVDDHWVLSGTPDEADAGDHPVTLTAQDGYNEVTQLFTIAVSVNQAPYFTSADAASAVIAEPFSFDVTVADDDGDALTIEATVLPGWLSITNQGENTVTLSGTPVESDMYTVELSVSDGLAGAQQTLTIDVVFGFDPPTAAELVVATTGQGVAVDVDVIAMATIAADDVVSLTVETPDNGAATVAIVDEGQLVRYTPDADFTGVETFGYTITGLTGSDSGTIAVTINRPPVFTSASTLEVGESEAVSFDVTASDPEGDALTFVLGGAPDWLELHAVDDARAMLTGMPSGAGVYEFTIEARDAYNVAAQQFTLSVVGEEEFTLALSVPQTLIDVGEATQLTATFGPVAPGTYRVEWDFGDGESFAEDVVVATSEGAASAGHAYAAYAVYVVSVAVSAVDQLLGRADDLVVVADPNLSVAGNGTIESRAGAYRADPSVEGTARFGFKSRYQRGASTPTGNTSFRFRAASLDFKGTDMDHLVISNGRAQYVGTGELNGVAGYSFRLIAVDADTHDDFDTDQFRIRIWGTAEGETGGLVYDNQWSCDAAVDLTADCTALASGKVTIRRQGGGPKNSLEVDFGDDLPTTFTLVPSYPNPFAISTTIGFDVPEQAHVRLSVYDALGRQVTVLVDDTIDAGRHSASFDGRDLASGVYVVRLSTETGFVQTHRMTLVR